MGIDMHIKSIGGCICIRWKALEFDQGHRRVVGDNFEQYLGAYLRSVLVEVEAEVVLALHARLPAYFSGKNRFHVKPKH